MQIDACDFVTVAVKIVTDVAIAHQVEVLSGSIRDSDPLQVLNASMGPTLSIKLSGLQMKGQVPHEVSPLCTLNAPPFLCYSKHQLPLLLAQLYSLL